MSIFNQLEYYHKIKKLNIHHYTGEIPYYLNAPLRNIEIKILKSLKPNSRILDLGCGSGRFSIGAAKMGFRVYGLDITSKAIDAAKQKSKQLKLKNINFFVGDMINLPFKNNTFDYILCPRFSINAVATFSKRKETIKEMLRVVKKDGLIFIESFNKLYLGNGPILPLKNILWDIWKYFKILFSGLINKKYNGLLPGDIIYKSNKIIGAPIGYAHLPTIFELKRLIPKYLNIKFYSIPQIVYNKKLDIFKFFRYSIWIIISSNPT